MTSSKPLGLLFKRKKEHTDELLKDLYYAIKKPRMIERKMLIYLRKGLITKWFAGIGQVFSLLVRFRSTDSLLSGKVR